jgi:peroxiredoxin
MNSSFNFSSLLDSDLYTAQFWDFFWPIPPRMQWQIGDALPDFYLPDATSGTTFQLNQRDRPVVLAFTRIFTPKTICPFCAPHIQALKESYPQFQAQNLDLVMISSLDSESAQNFAQGFELPFPFLSDPLGQVFRLYGTGQALGAPLSAQFVRDRQGQLQFQHLFSFLDYNASLESLLGQRPLGPAS